MPDSASTPIQPRLDGQRDQVVPGLAGGDGDHHAAAASAVLGVDRRRRSSRPRRRCRRSRSSATTRLLPPPSTSTGSPAVSALDQRVDQLGLGRRAHPALGRAAEPQGGVVGEPLRHADDGLRHAEHLLPVAGDGERHRGQPVGLGGLAGDLDVDAALGGYDDRVGELAAEADHLGAGEPGRHRTRGQRHRVHPVRDHAGQPDAGARPPRPGGSGCGRRWPRRTRPGRRG